MRRIIASILPRHARARRAGFGRGRPYRPAGRDPLVDRRREQPHHAHRRGLQRPLRGRTGGARAPPSACRPPSRATRRCRTPGCRRARRGRRAGRRAAPRRSRRAAAPAPQGGYTVRPGDTLSALAAGAGVSVADMAAMNGLDPAGLLVVGHPDQAADRRARSRAVRRARTRAGGPGGRSGADAGAPRPGRHPVRRVPVRRLPLARRRDRLAGERVQQRDGLLRERARRHAGHAGHVGLRAAEPLAAGSWTRTRRPTTSMPA